jgi:hypothetical protein
VVSSKCIFIQIIQCDNVNLTSPNRRVNTSKTSENLMKYNRRLAGRNTCPKESMIHTSSVIHTHKANHTPQTKPSISPRLALLFQLQSTASLLKHRPTSSGRVHGRRRRAVRCRFGPPARWVVVVPARVRRHDAPGVGGRPLDLLAHVAVICGALVVAPAGDRSFIELHHKFQLK